jgi:hypothetical protein
MKYVGSWGCAPINCPPCSEWLTEGDAARRHKQSSLHPCNSMRCSTLCWVIEQQTLAELSACGCLSQA